MEETTNREKILKKVRAALINKSRQEQPPVDFDSSVYPLPTDPLELIFAQQFTDVAGQFVFCENEEDFCYNIAALISEEKPGIVWCVEKNWQSLLQKAEIKFHSETNAVEKADLSVTGCEYLIARTGSILVSSRQDYGRRGPFFPHAHLVVAYTSQLVFDLNEALEKMKEKHSETASAITVITGPSRTADVEKTLVQGAHGPKDLYVFLIDDLPAQSFND
jgi:L-lactate dehydrogenase complex protein LldG